jgi:hypothetical protein
VLAYLWCPWVRAVNATARPVSKTSLCGYFYSGNSFQIVWTTIGSPKRRVECTNNASKCQFALSSPIPLSFVARRKHSIEKHLCVLIYIDYTSTLLFNWVLVARDKWQRNGASLMQIDIWKHYWCILHAVLGCLWDNLTGSVFRSHLNKARSQLHREDILWL